MIALADTHCHLNDAKFDADREAVLARARAALQFMVVVDDPAELGERAGALTGEGVYAAVGYHPYHANRVDDRALEGLRALAERPGVVAIGELGLDYFNEFSPRADQRLAMIGQLELAQAVNLPVIIHCRQAEDDTLAILQEYGAGLRGCIMHCFGGDAGFASRCAALGCYISFAGNVTYPKAQPLRDAALIVPEDRLLVETDAPYLAPQPVRGQRCEPVFVAHTAAGLAALRGVTLEALAAQTTENARRVFGLDNHNEEQPKNFTA